MSAMRGMPIAASTMRENHASAKDAAGNPVKICQIISGTVRLAQATLRPRSQIAAPAQIASRKTGYTDEITIAITGR